MYLFLLLVWPLFIFEVRLLTCSCSGGSSCCTYLANPKRNHGDSEDFERAVRVIFTQDPSGRTWCGGKKLPSWWKEPWPPVDMFFRKKNTLHSIGPGYISWCKTISNPRTFCFLDGVSNLPNRWQERVPGHQLLNFSCIFVPPAPFWGLLKFPLTSLRGSHVPIYTGWGCILINEYLYCIMNLVLCIYLYMNRCVVEIPCEHDQRMGFHITGEGIPVLLTDAMIHFRTNSYTTWLGCSLTQQPVSGKWLLCFPHETHLHPQMNVRNLRLTRNGWNLRFMSFHVWPAIKTLAEPKFDLSEFGRSMIPSQ